MYNKQTRNLLDELFLVVAYILCICGVVFSFENFVNPNVGSEVSEILNQIILGVVVISSVLFFEMTQNNNTLKSFIGFKKSNLKLYFIYSIIGFLFVVLFSSILNFLSEKILPQMPTFFDNVNSSSLNHAYLISILIAPFSEEIFFRGFLQNILTQKFGIKIGIVLTVLAFSILHTGYMPYSAAFLSIVFMGTVLSVVKHQTHSLIPSIFIHLLNNILAYTVLFN